MPVLAVLAAAVLGVGAALDGFETAPKAEPEELGKGAEFDQGLMRTRFQQAVVTLGGRDELGVVDRRYLRVILNVTNLSDATISSQTMNRALPTVWADGKILKAPGLAGPNDGPRIMVAHGGHAYDQLQPGVPVTVIMAFEMAAGQPAPKTVQIDAATFDRTERFSDGGHDWLPRTEEGPPTADDLKKGRGSSEIPVVAAHVKLPVEAT